MVGELDMKDILMIADTLVDKIPYARKVIIRKAAHMINLEQPEIFNSTVLAFLRDDARYAMLQQRHIKPYIAAVVN